MSRQQEFICGLSHEVTIAVLPRLNVEELMFELNRRIQNLDQNDSIKDRLVSILRDVMLEEYRKLEMKSEVSSPGDMTISVQSQETAAMQENVLTAYAKTMLPETSSPDALQKSYGLDIMIKKERDTSSDLLVPQFDTEQEQLTGSQQDQICNTPSPGSQTIALSKTSLTQMNTISDSLIKEEVFATTTSTEDETVRGCHDELNINTPAFSMQAQDTLHSVDTSYSETPVESDIPDEEAPSASCHLPPNNGDVHIKRESHLLQHGQIVQISQPSNLDQTEYYADARETGFINSRHEESDKDSSKEITLTSCQPNSDQDYEKTGSHVSDTDSQIGSKRYVYELETPFVNSSSMHRKLQKGEKPFFMCGECGYRACHQCRLVEHMIKHTGEKPFKCDQCNYKASYKRYLKDHMKCHTDAEPYSCEICGYQAYRKSLIERHMMCHSGVKPYKCEECDYKTAQKTNLARHRRRHTGERPYSCQECEYRAAVKSNLVQHMKSKHQ